MATLGRLCPYGLKSKDLFEREGIHRISLFLPLQLLPILIDGHV
jgi:hypothetical protein